MPARKWSEVTREERFFTSFLFHDVQQNQQPLLKLLQSKLELQFDISIIDVGYEVCFFRDAYHTEPKLIKKRQRPLEKQTFDIMLWLSDQSIVIIEAKAQQGFSMKQLDMLDQSLSIMLELSSPEYRIKQIQLVGLCSSRYYMKDSTASRFNAVIRWNEIVKVYPLHATEYNRADEIYGN